jgi:4-hydroxy-3-polyprenylbenzoate decarboxylase
MDKKKLVVCITGATGEIYGYRLLLATSKIPEVETYAVLSKDAEKLLKYELGKSRSDVEKLANHFYDENDFFAPISSGSFRVDATIIAPCSMKTLAAVSTGYADNLVARAASIALKDHWPLIILPRETPLSSIHLENMLKVARAGGIIMPPLPPLYHRRETIKELVDLTIGRILNMIDIRTSLHKEWKPEDR